MRTEFVHLADVHLGNKQYGSPVRFDDFGRAFGEAVDYAVDRRVAFAIIAGDLFHRSAIDAATLSQAVAGLERLRAASIPVIAVEGNHERPRYRDELSWLDFLAQQRLIHLLNPHIVGGDLEIRPWDGTSGTFIDIAGVRVYGIKYYGASMPRVLNDVSEWLRASGDVGVSYAVGALHAGLEGEAPFGAGIVRMADLITLRPWLDYVALGHIHKPYERDGWIYNPGALETCDLNEWQWGGGFYHVVIDTDQFPRHQARLIRNRRRPFCRLHFAVDGHVSPVALFNALERWLADRAAESRHEERPVVELKLHGLLEWSRFDLDLGQVQRLVEQAFDPLIVRARNDAQSRDSERPFNNSRQVFLGQSSELIVSPSVESMQDTPLLHSFLRSTRNLYSTDDTDSTTRMYAPQSSGAAALQSPPLPLAVSPLPLAIRTAP